MRRRRNDVPLDRDPSGRHLPWLVAIMVYLATLALVCAVELSRVAVRWDTGLSGRLTIQIPPPNDDEVTKPPGGQGALERVIALLLATPGIISAEVLEPDEIARLLEPWLGAAARSADLPMPTLIAVTVDRNSPPDLARLGREITAVAPGASIDDHQAWLGRLRAIVRSIGAVALLVVGLVTLSAVTIVVFATRMGLSVHSEVIELLHLIGALDSYVARQFQSHVLSLALRGGVFGLLMAVLTIFAVWSVFDGRFEALGALVRARGLEVAAVAVLPLAIAFIAMMTARWTVLRTLGRMP